jgi:CPA1 family monovalent cation:H+ antiporter
VAPLVRLLKLDGDNGLAAELGEVRVDLASAALQTLKGKKGAPANHWRYAFETSRADAAPEGDSTPFETRRRLGLAAIKRQRERLEELRAEERVGADAFLIVQEELDFQEVALVSEDERHIEES